MELPKSFLRKKTCKKALHCTWKMHYGHVICAKKIFSMQYVNACLHVELYYEILYHHCGTFFKKWLKNPWKAIFHWEGIEMCLKATSKCIEVALKSISMPLQNALRGHWDGPQSNVKMCWEEIEMLTSSSDFSQSRM